MANWFNKRRLLRKQTRSSTQQLAEGSSRQPEIQPQPLPEQFNTNTNVVDSPAPSFSTYSSSLHTFLPQAPHAPNQSTHPLGNFYASLDNDTTIIISPRVQSPFNQQFPSCSSTKSSTMSGSPEIAPLIPSSTMKPDSWYRKRKFRILLPILVFLVIGGVLGGVLGGMRIASHETAVATRSSSSASQTQQTRGSLGGDTTINTAITSLNTTIQVSGAPSTTQNKSTMTSTIPGSPAPSPNFHSIAGVTFVPPPTATTASTLGAKNIPSFAHSSPTENAHVPIGTLTEGGTVVVVVVQTVTEAF